VREIVSIFNIMHMAKSCIEDNFFLCLPYNKQLINKSLFFLNFLQGLYLTLGVVLSYHLFIGLIPFLCSTFVVQS